MYFNSLQFLLLFLPTFLIVYLITDSKYKNLIVLAASLLFFAWHQPLFVPLMAVIILANYYLGRSLGRSRGQAVKARTALIVGCSFNLVILVFFKTLVSSDSSWLPGHAVDGIKRYLFPLGLSYVAFQMISYLIDVYNETCDDEKSLLNFGTYGFLFPKILVGPIVRYRDLAGQLAQRESRSQDAAEGARRFARGLMKKTLIADTLANTINPAFSLPTPIFPRRSPGLC